MRDDICPLGHNPVCDVIVSATDEDIDKAEKAIAQWAAEHPEPVYPTWYEFLTNRYHKAWEAIGCDEISADIAEKLGVKPKGANNATD